jgi:hypothetical protein
MYKSLFWLHLTTFYSFCACTNLWYAWLIKIARMLPRNIDLWRWYICTATILFYILNSLLIWYIFALWQILPTDFDGSSKNNVQHVSTIATWSASQVSSKNHHLTWEGPFRIAFTRWTPAPNHLQYVPSMLYKNILTDSWFIRSGQFCGMDRW